MNLKKLTSEFTYQGYLSQEAQEFFGEHLITEQRDGIPVVGYWVKTKNNNKILLEKGLKFLKDEKGIHLLFELQ